MIRDIRFLLNRAISKRVIYVHNYEVIWWSRHIHNLFHFYILYAYIQTIDIYWSHNYISISYFLGISPVFVVLIKNTFKIWFVFNRSKSGCFITSFLCKSVSQVKQYALVNFNESNSLHRSLHSRIPFDLFRCIVV